MDVAISNDLMLPSKPPVMMVADSDVDEPVLTAKDKSGPDSMLCVSNNRLFDGFSLEASWTRIAPSQLVEARSFLPPSSEDEAGRYCSADIPSGNLSNSLASGGGCEAICFFNSGYTVLGLLLCFSPNSPTVPEDRNDC